MCVCIDIDIYIYLYTHRENDILGHFGRKYQVLKTSVKKKSK